MSEEKDFLELTEEKTAEALLRAILELINKCDSLDELKEIIKRIIG